MAKTKEELNQLKQELESLNQKLKELTDDELKQVTGGFPYSPWSETLDTSELFENGERYKR